MWNFCFWLFAVPAASAPRHDPSTGFHDIKPIPQFHPLPNWLIAVLVLIIALAFLLWLRRYVKNRASLVPAEPPVPADRRALAELKRLDELRLTGETDIRSLSTALSLTVRRYFEEVFLFPASDLTVSEVCQLLPAHVKKALPILPQQMIDNYLQTSRHLLRLWEKATFDSSAELAYPLECQPLIHSIEKATELIRDLSAALKRETVRTSGIISQSKLAGDKTNAI